MLYARDLGRQSLGCGGLGGKQVQAGRTLLMGTAGPHHTSGTSMDAVTLASHGVALVGRCIYIAMHFAKTQWARRSCYMPRLED